MDGGLGKHAMPNTNKFDDVYTALAAGVTLADTAPLEDWRTQRTRS
jgi:hypothetical protein